jgi:hypothetical protein
MWSTFKAIRSSTQRPSYDEVANHYCRKWTNKNLLICSSNKKLRDGGNTFDWLHSTGLNSAALDHDLP